MPEGIKKLRWKRESNPCARFCRPLPHHSAIPPWRYRLTHKCAGADDETRTRDPHLGKVMRYQLRYIRIASYKLLCVTTVCRGASRNIIAHFRSFQIRRIISCFYSAARYRFSPNELHQCHFRILFNRPIRSCRRPRCRFNTAPRSYSSVGERSVHTGKVAGSIPARTTAFLKPASFIEGCRLCCISL